MAWIGVGLSGSGCEEVAVSCDHGFHKMQGIC